MASRSELSRNNIRMGIFVLVSLVLAVMVIVTLSGLKEKLWQKYRQYTVTFPVRAGVSGLETGSKVRVGGIEKGSVLEVRLRIEDDVFKHIDVLFQVNEDITLYQDARVAVGKAILGGDAWLSIYSVGSSDPLNRIVDNDKVIEGVSAPGLMGAFLGQEKAGEVETVGILGTVLSAGQQDKVDEILENARGFTAFARNDLPGDYNENIKPVIKRVRTDYEANVPPALEGFREAGAKTGEMVTDAVDVQWPKWSEDLSTALSEGRQVVTENRPKVTEFMDDATATSENARQASDRFKEETIDRIHVLIQSGQTAVDDAGQAISTMRQDYESWTSNLDRTLADAALASQQLKLATVEIRRNPWKILYRPGLDELDHELLYEAARSFAVAATDLRGATNSVQHILQNYGDRLGEDETSFQRMKQNLKGSFERYEKAQQELFDVLATQ